MDDRIEPERPSWAGHANPAGGGLRARSATYASDHARLMRDPWSAGAHLRPPAPRDPEPAAGRSGTRFGLWVAGGAALCAAAVGVLSTTHGRLASPDRPATSVAADLRSLPVEVAPAPAGAAAAPTATEPKSQVAAPVERLEAFPPLPPLPPETRAAPRAPVASSEPVPASRPVPASAGSGPVRVFIHVTSAAQRPAADEVRAALGGMSFGGRSVEMPPVRFVAASPGRTELRCLKHADCPAAERVARYLSGRLGTPVSVVDMSRQYERNPQVRPGSLELWLQR